MEKPTDTDLAFEKATNEWVALSSGDTVPGELLNFVGQLGKLAKSLSDILSVANKYL